MTNSTQMMDLEISNASLRAINKTLEREMRKQAAELRRYKRLARAGRLSSAPSISNLISPEDDEEADDAVDIGDETDDTSVADTEGESEFGFDDEEGEDTETEQLSEEEEDEDEDGSEGAIDEKHREADEKRLTWDLSKHQSLLDASSRMNKSLRGCMFLTDQLIREARKALEHKIRPSDIRLGGRILCDEEDYYEPVEAADASAAEEEAEEDELGLQPEEEAVVAAAEEPGVYHHRYFIPPELRPVRHGLL